MSERDYGKWHQEYDDPDSGISQRLRAIQGVLRDVPDRHGGQLRILSACAGERRDGLDVLAGRRVLGVVRHDGPPQPLVAGRHLFAFVR